MLLNSPDEVVSLGVGASFGASLDADASFVPPRLKKGRNGAGAVLLNEAVGTLVLAPNIPPPKRPPEEAAVVDVAPLEVSAGFGGGLKSPPDEGAAELRFYQMDG